MHRDGILLLDKPAGVTSFKVVDHVRRQLVRTFPELDSRSGKRRPGAPKPPRFKCGHAGTLDPLATGLLVVLVGKGSRLSPFLMGLDKTYAATVRFGAATDTLDREGQVVDKAPVPGDPGVLEDVLPCFLGEIMQVPPLISALKKDGKALYKRVRAGEDVAEPEARPVAISRLEVTATRWGGEVDGEKVYEADLLVGCGSGTYIRSLARDIAVACGTVGHIHQLRRLRVGPFGVDDSTDGVLDMDGEGLAAVMRPLAEALPQVPVLMVDEDEAAALRQGTQPRPEWLDRLDGVPVVCGKAAGPIFRMVDARGQLVAVGEVDQGTGYPILAVVIPADPNSDGDRTCA
jgi:tRNA pseudouridine55 synthase